MSQWQNSQSSMRRIKLQSVTWLIRVGIQVYKSAKHHVRYEDKNKFIVTDMHSDLTKILQ